MGSPEAAATRSLLVTGAPRSGTTWLARQLADRPRAGMPGREPMNPRRGQLALGGTLGGWVQEDDFDPRQRRTLRRCAAGLEPRTYSRYGVRQLRGALPWTTTVVKDPFALLSVPAVVRATGARPVVVYRHPGAVLASYRRMGWRPDVAEVQALGAPDLDEGSSDASEMALFWTFLHARVLAWLPQTPGALVVSHAEVTTGGDAAVEALARACHLAPRRARRSPVVGGAAGRRPGLHDFRRDAEDVVEGWRRHVDAADQELLEGATRQVWDQLEQQRFVLPAGDDVTPRGGTR